MEKVSVIKYLLFFGALASFFFCTFYQEEKKPLTMTRIDMSGDTVSIWPSLTFLFSTKLKDSCVNLNFEPDPGAIYNSYLNKTRDTLRVTASAAFDGNTLYTITLKESVVDLNDMSLAPEEVSFAFFTQNREVEPNNSIAYADTLKQILQGSNVPLNDTDCIYISTVSYTRLLLHCFKGRPGCMIKDSTGSAILLTGTFENGKTILLSDSVSLPCYLFIYSLFDNETRYEAQLK